MAEKNRDNNKKFHVLVYMRFDFGKLGVLRLTIEISQNKWQFLNFANLLVREMANKLTKQSQRSTLISNTINIHSRTY